MRADGGGSRFRRRYDVAPKRRRESSQDRTQISRRSVRDGVFMDNGGAASAGCRRIHQRSGESHR